MREMGRASRRAGVLSRIRQDTAHLQPIVVAVTAWAREEDQHRAYDAGFDLHVAKPVSLERLKELTAMLRPVATRTTLTWKP